jgi:hypothetical protein
LNLAHLHPVKTIALLLCRDEGTHRAGTKMLAPFPLVGVVTHQTLPKGDVMTHVHHLAPRRGSETLFLLRRLAGGCGRGPRQLDHLCQSATGAGAGIEMDLRARMTII